jgi:hypothetical protein
MVGRGAFGFNGFYFVGERWLPKTLGTCELKERLPDTNKGMMNDHQMTCLVLDKKSP